MAAMTTPLVQFSDQLNARTYRLPNHTALKPQLVIQKRKVPSGQQSVLEDTITVLSATSDASSVPLAARVSFSVTIRRPNNGSAADVTAMLAYLRDIVAGDEFGNTVTTQDYLK